MVKEKSWEEFRKSGLLWWINSILHTFGWSIYVEIDDNGKITGGYPARVKFRGFNEKTNTEGYMKVTNYLKDNIEELQEETKEE